MILNLQNLPTKFHLKIYIYIKFSNLENDTQSTKSSYKISFKYILNLQIFES